MRRKNAGRKRVDNHPDVRGGIKAFVEASVWGAQFPAGGTGTPK